MSLFEKLEAKRIWTREEGFFRLRCRLFCTFKVSIAFAIRSVDPPLGLGFTGLWRFYTPSRSLSHSLFAHLIPSGAFKGWCAVRTLRMYFSNKFYGSSIVFVIHSVDPSLSSQLIPAHSESESH